MRDQDWDDLRFVLAVARHGSFAGAARQLGVNESTVARRVAKAEGRLQARLFERAGSDLTVTGAGQELVRRAEIIETEVRAGEETVTGSDHAVSGNVQITAVPSIVNRILAPQLPGLINSHPHLRVSLIAESTDLSLIRGEADIALRLARPQRDARAIARRIADIPYGVFAAADYGGEPPVWLTYIEEMANVPQCRWVEQQLAQHPDARLSGLRVNDSEALCRVLKAGAGMSFLPLFMAADEAGLARMDDGSQEWSRELWMMVHPDLRSLARIQVTLEWIHTALADGLGDQVARP